MPRPQPVRRELTVRVRLQCGKCDLLRSVACSTLVARRLIKKLMSYTCPSCGYLAMYARGDEEQDPAAVALAKRPGELES